MLMITEKRNAKGLTFNLLGALAGNWAMELERCWRAAAGESEQLRIFIDLTEVTHVDETGKRLLALMASAGAELIAGDVLMKSIVEEINGAIQGQLS